MSRKNFTTEKIIGMLRELEVSEQSYYRWRREAYTLQR